MTEQQIIETLATKVMGWEKHEVELDLTDGGTQKFFDSWRMNGREVATHWSPLHNIADAIQLAEQAFGEEWILHKHDGGYSCKGVTSNGKIGNEYLEETREGAICNAVQQILEEYCNYLGECVRCKDETELMPYYSNGICLSCSEG
ncbi:hypothetical protein [Brevibacillus brevis]|uniref:BC1872 family protein n=1 Tax=Brevibacillus brevis TaxID=1393 RepID=UPI0037CCA3C3